MMRASFSDLIAKVAATRRPEAAFIPTNNTQRICWIMPLRESGDGPTIAGPRRLLVLLTEPSQSCIMTADHIVSLWRLTPAEARLAIAIAQGQSLNDYAATARLSLNTVRNQCAAIFEKTGVSRQGELITLIASAQAAASAWKYE
jgi:DNA-binding CsgD family transcriptional regulator